MRMLTGGLIVLAGSILGSGAMIAYALGRAHGHPVDASPAACGGLILASVGLVMIVMEYKRPDAPDARV